MKEIKQLANSIGLRNKYTWLEGLALVSNVSELIRKHFDNAYFEEQIEHISRNTTNRDKELRVYFDMLSRDQLYILFVCLIRNKKEKGLFVSNHSFIDMNRCFDEEGSKINLVCPNFLNLNIREEDWNN